MLGALVADGAAASLADRGHSFASLSLPPAAVGSLPILNSQFTIALFAPILPPRKQQTFPLFSHLHLGKKISG